MTVHICLPVVLHMVVGAPWKALCNFGPLVAQFLVRFAEDALLLFCPQSLVHTWVCRCSCIAIDAHEYVTWTTENNYGKKIRATRYLSGCAISLDTVFQSCLGYQNH